MSDIEIMTVFDRQMVREHRERCEPKWDDFDFLHKEVAFRLCDRLEDVIRDFPLALDLGCHGGEISQALENSPKVHMLVQCDLSQKMAKRAAKSGHNSVVCDEEFLPFAPNSFDLIVSNLNLHWVNDLPGTLLQINRCLKPDGLFIGAMFGIETLRELRQCLNQSEMDIDGGISPRISPFADVRDAGMLLQRAGFTLPVVDADGIEVRYENPMKLLKDLKGMAQNNKVLERRKNMTKRSMLFNALQTYVEEFTGDDGRVPATFQVMYMTAWKDDPSQQKPLQPGSGANAQKLADALGVPEHILAGKEK